MSKAHKFPVQVKTATDEAGSLNPLAIYWDDEPYPVEIIKRRELDTFWNNSGDGLYFLVQAGGRTADLVYNRTADNWTLEVQAM